MQVKARDLGTLAKQWNVSASSTQSDIIWDFDGTMVPFDSEQALLRSLSQRPRRKLGVAKALFGRLLAWADERNYLEGLFKRLYAFCLRGLPVTELDAVAEEIARHITPADRLAIRALANSGKRMVVVSCGTGDLSQRVLQHAGVLGCFAALEANWFTFWQNRIEGIDLHIHLPSDKLEAVARLGIDLADAVAIGDGVTDIPLLDRAACAILVDRNGKRATWAAARGYRVARSLAEIANLLGVTD